MDKQMLIQPGIQPGGQLNAYLVRAAMSAVSSPNFDNQYGDTPQAPEWFAVNGAGLLNTGLTNTGGSYWGETVVTAWSGTTPDITPLAASGSGPGDYTFTNYVTNLITIVDANSGQDLTLQTNTVIVGQQMNLRCQPTSTNFPATNFQWTVPGYAISNYVVAADASSAMVVTNIATNSANVAFYWLDGASNRVVQCSATVNGFPITGRAIFNVSRPDGTLSATTTTNMPPVAINGSGDSTALQFGANNFIRQQAGIYFLFSVPGN